MRESYKTPVTLCCEQLEARELLAGNVTAQLLPTGVLRIIGDDLANEIQITSTGSAGEVRVAGYLQAGAPTKLNKQSSPLTFKPTAGIQVLMKGGMDDLLIKGAVGNTLRILGSYGLIVDMGADTDLLDVSHVRVAGPCDLYAGNGKSADTISAAFSTFDKHLHVSVGDGDNTVDLLSCTAAGMLKVDASGNGNDTFTLSEVASTLDKVWVVMNGGNDTLEVDHMWSKLAATLDGGSGYDTLHLGVHTAPKVNFNAWESYF